MKKLVLLALVAILSGSMVHAQNNMTEAEKAEFQQYQEFKKMKQPPAPAAVESVAQTVSKYAGLGKEIGSVMREAVQAFDGTLTVTEEHVYKFLNTGIGKTTLAIIVWKVLGKDVLQITAGIILLALAIWWVRFWVTAIFYGKMIVKSVENKVEKLERISPLNETESGDSFGGYCLVAIVGSIALTLGGVLCIVL